MSADTVATGLRQRGIRLIDCGFGNDPDPARGELTALHTAGVRRAKAQRLVVVRVGADVKVGYFLHLGEAVLRCFQRDSSCAQERLPRFRFAGVRSTDLNGRGWQARFAPEPHPPARIEKCSRDFPQQRRLAAELDTKASFEQVLAVSDDRVAIDRPAGTTSIENGVEVL